MSSKITRLQVTFRNLENLVIDFTDPQGAPVGLMVVAGPTASGKTSVLDALEELTSSPTQRQKYPYLVGEMHVRRGHTDGPDGVITCPGPGQASISLIYIKAAGAYPKRLPARLDDKMLANLNVFWGHFFTGHFMQVTGGDSDGLVVLARAGKLISLTDLSLGEQSILAIADPLLGRPQRLVLIDNPAAYLDLKRQRSLVTALRELAPYAQFVLATNSDEIWDSAMSYERVQLTD